MISLKTHKTSLVNLHVTIKALETLDELIACYNEDKPGPAYVTFTISGMNTDVQLQRPLAVGVLNQQRQSLVDYLATLGIEA